MLTEPGLSRRSTRLKLPPSADPQQIASTLTQLAWALDRFGSPIDYARRRRIFLADSIHLDQAALTEVCTRHGLRRHYHRRDALLSWILWSALLGSDAPTSRDHAAERHYRRHLPTCLKDFVHQQAEAHLHSAGVNEPVQWEPPAEWVIGVLWPGIDPAGVSQSRVNELATQAPGERELANNLGMTTDQLDLYCEAHDVDYPAPATHPTRYTPREPVPGPNRSIRRVPRTGDLAPDRLRQLYQDQGESLTQIAARTNCSTSTVSQVFREFGILTRLRRPPGTLERSVSRTWLEDEYIRKGRSSPDIARELGLAKSDILSLLHKWDIPRHPQLSSNVFAALTLELSPAMTTLSRTPNILPRLRNIIRLPGHQSFQAAANALGVARGVLDHQLRQVEAATGITVIDRSHPLSATDSGRRLIAEAERLLELLDEHTQ
ncbi:hypothetical protein EDD99_5387 [Streptomyces sp. 846.5]|nr:hypothetical protein EDD99_5387 [Streptomyces sp. 846.5]